MIDPLFRWCAHVRQLNDSSSNISNRNCNRNNKGTIFIVLSFVHSMCGPHELLNRLAVFPGWMA